MMNNLSTTITVSVLSLLIFGCGSVQIPKVTSYSIDSPNVREMVKNDIAIAVERVRGRSLYGKKNIVVSPKNYVLDYYVSAQWADTPCKMLTDDIISYLSKKYPYVTSSVRNGNGKTDYTISVYIDKLNQEKRNGKWYADTAFHYEIFSNKKNKLLCNKWFRNKVELNSSNVDNYVKAQNDSVTMFLQQLASEIEKLAATDK